VIIERRYLVLSCQDTYVDTAFLAHGIQERKKLKPSHQDSGMVSTELTRWEIVNTSAAYIQEILSTFLAVRFSKILSTAPPG
jgi:hypothetical protein